MGGLTKNRKTKYRNEPTLRGEIKFQSKKEANFFDGLVLQQRAGAIQGFLRQIPVRLPGGVTYWCDFLVKDNDGTLHWIDVKGVKTRVYLNKKKILEAIYPWIQVEER